MLNNETLLKDLLQELGPPGTPAAAVQTLPKAEHGCVSFQLKANGKTMLQVSKGRFGEHTFRVSLALAHLVELGHQQASYSCPLPCSFCY